MLDGITLNNTPTPKPKKILKTISYWHPFYVSQQLSEYIHGFKTVYCKYELVIYDDKTCESCIVEKNISEEEFFKRHLDGTIQNQ